MVQAGLFSLSLISLVFIYVLEWFTVSLYLHRIDSFCLLLTMHKSNEYIPVQNYDSPLCFFLHHA